MPEAARTASSRLCQFSVGIWFRFSSWPHLRKSPPQFKHYSLTPACHARRGDAERALNPRERTRQQQPLEPRSTARCPANVGNKTIDNPIPILVGFDSVRVQFR